MANIKQTYTCEVDSCKGKSEGVMCAICNRWICFKHAFRNPDISEQHFCEEHWHSHVMRPIERKPVTKTPKAEIEDMFIGL